MRLERRLMWAGLGAILGLVVTAAGAETITVDGVDRTYQIVKPYAAERLPLVVALHGQGGSGDQLRRATGWQDLAASDRFAVVYPDAIDGAWRLDWSQRNPDVDFLLKLVGKLVGDGTADPKRVYLFGHSRGAAMSFAMICAKSAYFAAAAPMSGGLAEGSTRLCQPQRPMPMLILHGTADPLLPYAGGASKAPGSAGAPLMSVPALVVFWGGVNGCAPAGQAETQLPDPDKTDKSTVTELRSRCPAARDVTHYRVNGGGHMLPSRPARSAPAREPLLGPVNHDIDAAAAAWSFLKRFSL